MTEIGTKPQPEVSGIPLEVVTSLGHAAAMPDRLAGAFRDLILAGQWKPGSQVVETAVARAFHVSQPTVREALKQLEGEGLILRRQYRSCEVTKLTREEVDQIFRLRVEWEALAAELAAEKRAEKAPDELLAAAEKLKRAARDRDTDAFYRHDLEFHKTLWAYSGNPFLAKALSQITVPLFAFWTLRHLRDSDVDLKKQALAHEEVAQAVFSGEAKQARSVTLRAMKGFWRDGARVTREE